MLEAWRCFQRLDHHVITVGGAMGPAIPIRWDLGGLSDALPLLADEPGEVLEYLLDVETVHIQILASKVRRR